MTLLNDGFGLRNLEHAWRQAAKWATNVYPYYDALAASEFLGRYPQELLAASCASSVVYPADSIYTRFGKTGEPSGGRMSVPSRVQLMNE